MAVVTLNTPSALVRSLQAAALQFISDEGDGLREDASSVHVYLAIAPLLPHYTVADVVPVVDLVRNAINRASGRGVQAARQGGALYQVLTLLEYFAAYARSSGAECVAVRAVILAESLEDDGVLCDRSSTVAAKSLQDDIATLTAGGPFSGERFDGWAKGSADSWIYGAMFDIEELSCIDVNEMRGGVKPTEGEAAWPIL